MKPEDARLEYRKIEFVLVRVHDHPLKAVPKRIRHVVDIALEHGAIVESITSSLVVLTFGIVESADDPARSREAVVPAVHDGLQGFVSVVHGHRRALVGNFGNAERQSFGSLLPGFNGLLKALMELDIGGVHEVIETTE